MHSHVKPWQNHAMTRIRVKRVPGLVPESKEKKGKETQTTDRQMEMGDEKEGLCIASEV
jgi:hypothetical protein